LRQKRSYFAIKTVNWTKAGDSILVGKLVMGARVAELLLQQRISSKILWGDDSRNHHGAEVTR
jgi:hypothetical protein